MIHTDEDDEFERIAHEAKIKGQPYYFDPSNGTISKDKNDPRFTPLGQLWPVSIKREWVGLTEEEILSDDILRYYYGMNGGAGPVSQKGKKVVAAIEAKLKEKNT